MRRAHLTAVALLLMSGLARPAPAAPVPAPAGTVVQAPNWIVGSEWYYSDGYALKVTSASPQATVFDRIDAPGQWFSRRGFLRKDAVSSTATRDAIYRTLSGAQGFSLKAGSPLVFQREYLSNGKLMVHATSWTVEGRETITVPAGTFDCWLIVWRTRSLRSDWTGFERWWYSPKAQQYVRLEYRYGPGYEGSRVLMRYRIGPAPAQATPGPSPEAGISQPGGPETQPEAFSPAKHPAWPAAALPDVPENHIAQTQTPPIAQSRSAPAPVPAATPSRAKPAAPSSLARQAANSAIPAALPVSTAGPWHAQLGSSKDEPAMRAGLLKIIAANPMLAALPYGVAPHAVAGRGIFYRGWVGAFDKAAAARGLCERLVPKTGCAVFRATALGARDGQSRS